MQPDKATIEATILQELAKLPPGKTLAAADIAQVLAPGAEGQALLQPIRRCAVDLAMAGRLVIYRKGKPVEPADFKGVWRMGPPPQG